MIFLVNQLRKFRNDEDNKMKEKICDREEHDENTVECSYCKQKAESITLGE